MHLLEKELIAELITPRSEQPAPGGTAGELVLTNVSRIACPVVRYRTGDVTRLERGCVRPCGNAGALLTGGVKRMQNANTSADIRPHTHCFFTGSTIL